jgi:hypothetical protein
MSRDPAPSTYVVEIDTPGHRWTPAPWNCRQNGRPTAPNLARYVQDLEASTMPGGCNSHLGATRVASARIRYNVLGGATVAGYAPEPAPLFTVVA